MDKLDYEEYFGTLMDKTDNMKKHPYYDSDRKKRTEAFALKSIAVCIVILIAFVIIEWLWL